MAESRDLEVPAGPIGLLGYAAERGYTPHARIGGPSSYSADGPLRALEFAPLIWPTLIF